MATADSHNHPIIVANDPVTDRLALVRKQLGRDVGRMGKEAILARVHGE